MEVNILDRYNNDPRKKEWAMDAKDQIKVSDGFTLVTSLISHKGDKVVYYETDGENANVVILDLESKEKIVMEDTVKLGGCVGFEYLPSRWSVNDKKIIREWVHVGDGGCSASVPWAYIIDVDSLEEEVLVNSSNNYIILEDEKVVTFGDLGQIYNAPGSYLNKIVIIEIESGKKEIIEMAENELCGDLRQDENGKITYIVETYENIVNEGEGYSLGSLIETRTEVLELE
jgi:hypothetical protein